jgi:dienelactone hydrolase
VAYSVCGFGEGAHIALECCQANKEISALALCCPTPQSIEAVANIKIPTILVLAGVDEIMSNENARMLTDILQKTGCPFQLRLYTHQKRGFVDKENIVASTSALNDILKWCRKHNNDPSTNGPWRIGE